MLRISGAMQVLEEVLDEEKSEKVVKDLPIMENETVVENGVSK